LTSPGGLIYFYVQNADLNPVKMWRKGMGAPSPFAKTVEWSAEQEQSARRKVGPNERLFNPSAQALHDSCVKTLRRNPFFQTDQNARPSVSRRMKAV
jgi:hypothetical protein